MAETSDIVVTNILKNENLEVGKQPLDMAGSLFTKSHPQYAGSNKRKHDNDDELNKQSGEVMESAKDASKTDDPFSTAPSPPKKATIVKQNVELDENSADSLRVKLIRNQVIHLAADKLDKLKLLHSKCVFMIGEELFLERKLIYADYTKWVAPQPLLNRDRLDYLSMKVSFIY